MSADRATAAQLETVNGRLKKGEGWIGYKFSTVDGEKIPSKFLYYAFYVNGIQRFVNTKTNDAEAAYRQLLAARGGVERGVTILPSESGRVQYQHLRSDYIADDPKREQSKQNKNHLNHLDAFFGKMKAASITTNVLRSYVNQRRKSVSDPTIRRELVVLRAMFNLAVKSKKISHDVMPWFPMPQDSLPAGQYITPEQFQKIRDCLPDGSKRESKNGGPKSESNLRPFFTFLYGTGCRVGAAQNIMWKHISPDCSTVEIPAGNTKNKQPLKLPLVGDLLEPIAKDLRKQFRNDQRPVFDSANFRHEWGRACAKAGLGAWDEKTRKRGEGNLRIHDCRASAAVNLLAAGVDEGLVLKIGGWKTRKMLDRYNIADPTRLAVAMKKGGKLVVDRMAQAK